MHVAVGIIFNKQGEVLIAQRPAHKYKGGLWEFPGGKIEPGETALQGLRRELWEEIGIKVLSATSWLHVQYKYADRDVLLDTWKVTQFLGEPIGKEGQLICWVPFDKLSQFTFPEGNREIIEQLK